MQKPWRTKLDDTLLDSLDFIEEMIVEAMSCRSARLAPITNAGDIIPYLNIRLREEDAKTRLTQFMLVFDDQRDRAWWDKFAQMPEPQFQATAKEVLAIVETLKTLLEGTET